MFWIVRGGGGGGYCIFIVVVDLCCYLGIVTILGISSSPLVSDWQGLENMLFYIYIVYLFVYLGYYICKFGMGGSTLFLVLFASYCYSFICISLGYR
jgi:hypothetical protein